MWSFVAASLAHIIKNAYLLYRYLVRVDDAKPYTVKAFQFSKFEYPVGSDVSVYGVQGKHNHKYYVIKLLAGHDNS